MSGCELERALLLGRPRGRLGLVWFVNAGDPSLLVTWEILTMLADKGVACIELCVPFANSPTDGPVMRASHVRALANGVTLGTVLNLAARARRCLGLNIVLLADYAHTVAPVGLESFLDQSAHADLCGTLLHGLPPHLRSSYVAHSRLRGLGRIMSFFAVSNEFVRRAAYRESEGFVYVVSRFGRTGTSTSTANDLTAHLQRFRAETSKALAVGFGINTAADIRALVNSGADAVVIGSAGVRVIERDLMTPSRIVSSLAAVVDELACACSAPSEARNC